MKVIHNRLWITQRLFHTIHRHKKLSTIERDLSTKKRDLSTGYPETPKFKGIVRKRGTVFMLNEVERIKKEVCEKYGVTIPDLEGSSRASRIVRARFEAMARCRLETSCSFPEIGYYFGRRDHSSIMYACKIYKKYPSRFSKVTG